MVKSPFDSNKSLSAIFEMKREQVEQEFSPYFYTYFKSIFEYPKKLQGYSRMCREIFDVTEAKDRKVLDVGCGFGLISIFLAIFGAREITGVDTSEEKILVFKKILSRFVPPLDNVEAKVADAIELDNETYDVIIANEVISHVRDIDSLVCRMNRLLRNGGIFYIKDGNNGLNFVQAVQRRRIWKIAEYGPADERTGPKLPYCEMRRKMIREKYPQMDEDTLKVLVKETAGF
jgi:2-polyprenyl-3-methyl-5-hydroxy-6-metoxy-1,4-benzoquinol methylase